MNEERFIHIETKLAYQEDTILALNEVVCQQQEDIRRLENLCHMLTGRLKELSETTSTSTSMLSDDIPPHY